MSIFRAITRCKKSGGQPWIARSQGGSHNFGEQIQHYSEVQRIKRIKIRLLI